MSRAPARFTQADLHRAIKAIAQAGGGMGIRIPLNGEFLILPAHLLVSESTPSNGDDLDSEEVIEL